MSRPLLEKAKQGLCQMITGCDGPFFLPCGHKTDNPKYCEEWKGVCIEEDEITKTDGGITCKDAVFARVKKQFLKHLEVQS